MPSLTKAGRYELLNELGRGAMGVVYRAKDPVIGRDVAVKTIRLVEAGTGLTREELVSRFQTEARAAGLLTHPNIVVIFDAGEEDGQFYITMELVEGSSLQALLDQGQSFPLPRVLRLMEQACAALEFAHQRLVVHRDIKPANLMLTQDDQLKITDFGTAKILQMGATQTATVIGTPSYMSPEQIKGNAVDGRSDIFALGVILYELVTGQKPFPGDNVTTVIYRVVNEEPIPPRQIDASIHPGLAAVITRALAKDPAERFENCREMSVALQNYHQAGGGAPTVRLPSRAPFPAVIPANSASSTQRVMPRAANPTPVPMRISTGPVSWQQPQRKRRRYALLALVLVALIAVAGWRAWPVILDFWQTGVKPALTSHLTSIKLGAPPSETPEPISSPTSASSASPTLIPKSSAPARASSGTSLVPIDSQPATSAPTPADTSAAPTAPTQPAERADSEPRPTDAAGAAEKRIDAYLASTGLTDAVQIHAAGDTLTLSGKLTSEDYRGLMSNLRELPANVRVIDHLEVAADSPEASAASATPPRASTASSAPAAGTTWTSRLGWVVARTVPRGALIEVDGVLTQQQTPAKLVLPPGQHLIVFSLEGYTAQSSVIVRPGKGSQIFQILSRP